MTRPLLLTAIAFLALGIGACQGGPEPETSTQSPAAVKVAEAAAPGALAPLPGSAYEVSTDAARDAWADGGAVLIDVREPSEHAAGHIPGVTLIPMGQVADRLDEIPEDQPVILTCRTGRRSLEVARQLRELGYDNVYSQRGGITEWQAMGLEIGR